MDPRPPKDAAVPGQEVRVGLMLAGGGGMTVPDMAELAARAEGAGFDGVYVAEAWRSGFDYDSLLRQQGHERVADEVDRLVRDGDLDAARRAVTDEVVDQLVVAGTPGDCIARIHEYGRSVDEVLFVNVSGMRYEAGSVADARRALLDSYQPLLELGTLAATGA